MKKNQWIIMGVLMVGMLASCSSKSNDSISSNASEQKNEVPVTTPFKTVQAKDLYELSVPQFMSKTTALNAEASLQYLSKEKEKYMIIIDESKKETIQILKSNNRYDESRSLIDNYTDVQLLSFQSAVKTSGESKRESITVNGMPVRIKNIDGDIEGVPVPVSYFLGFVEGEENMYMIMTWTLQSEKERFRNEANQIIRSIREL